MRHGARVACMTASGRGCVKSADWSPAKEIRVTQTLLHHRRMGFSCGEKGVYALIAFMSGTIPMTCIARFRL